MARRTHRTRRAAILVPVASMGDIAFLLIIFFMLCSNEAKKAGKEVVPPAALELQTLPKPRLYVAVDAEEQVFFQGRPATAGEIESSLAETIDPTAPPEGRIVVFECDHRVRKSVYEPLLEAIARAGGVIGAVGKDPGKTRRRGGIARRP